MNSHALGAGPRVALVTGGARRIGRQIALCLHAAGVDIALHCLRAVAEAEALAAELNAAREASVKVFRADLLDTRRLAPMVDEVAGWKGRLDFVVNNASSFYATPVGRIDEAAWEDLMGSNLRAPLFLSQAAVPWLKAARGAIVNIADIHADRPMRDHVVYSVAKAGLVALTRALAQELGPEVRVNAVSPGANVWPEDPEMFSEAARAEVLRTVPLQRVGAPDDIAGAVRFLLLEAPYVSGQVLAVDGGRSVVLS